MSTVLTELDDPEQINDHEQIRLIPFQKSSKSTIEKYHIVISTHSEKKLRHLKCELTNVYAPFGRQTKSDHKTKVTINQHRLNICWSKNMIKSESDSYMSAINTIKKIEEYWADYDELKTLNLVSNIIDRKEHGIVIRFHLNTHKDKTTTPLIILTKDDLLNSSNITESQSSSWLEFDKNLKLNIIYHPDCLWIDREKNIYGISLQIDKVIQFKIDEI